MSADFATTQWSKVLAAKDGTDTEARQALDYLCNAYWYPLYAYLRRRGQNPDQARDLTQAFFTELLEKHRLEAIDQSRGRFRSFLLASLRNFMSHELDKTQTLKRGGRVKTVSMDTAGAEIRYKMEPLEALTPEEIFERRWGLTMMERAMERLEAEYATKSEPSRFDSLKAYVTGWGSETPYKQAAKQLDMSEGAVKTAVHRMRTRYGQLLRDEIAQTLADPKEVDQELRHLLVAIRPWQSEPPR
ncbi:MAG: sigma-70 family RNA polymerase sigma factor [Acidobacteriota bacterium]